MKDNLKLSRHEKLVFFGNILGSLIVWVAALLIGWAMFLAIIKLVFFCFSLPIGLLPATGIYILLMVFIGIRISLRK